MHKLKPQYITLSETNRLYASELPIIGLTGGIASGKSEVSKKLKEQSICVIDADLLVKEIYQEKESLEFVKKTFSEDIIKNGSIDFMKLREEFFSNDNLKSQLESFIYQKLPFQFNKKLQAFKKLGAHFVVYDAPLIFEKSLHPKLDSVLLVYCSLEKQIERVMKRDSISKELASEIISSQMSLEEKRRLSQYIIPNNKGLGHLEKETLSFLNTYTYL